MAETSEWGPTIFGSGTYTTAESGLAAGSQVRISVSALPIISLNQRSTDRYLFMER